ncbi:hypothetical protein B0H13DRAFT_1869599 [Mycena leptocephala]|nr:hypothetical protein B0H13DRAFT_1869599 [Mycena leptocephala]
MLEQHEIELRGTRHTLHAQRKSGMRQKYGESAAKSPQDKLSERARARERDEETQDGVRTEGIQTYNFLPVEGLRCWFPSPGLVASAQSGSERRMELDEHSLGVASGMTSGIDSGMGSLLPTPSHGYNENITTGYEWTVLCLSIQSTSCYNELSCRTILATNLIQPPPPPGACGGTGHTYSTRIMTPQWKLAEDAATARCGPGLHLIVIRVGYVWPVPPRAPKLLLGGILAPLSKQFGPESPFVQAHKQLEGLFGNNSPIQPGFPNALAGGMGLGLVAGRFPEDAEAASRIAIPPSRSAASTICVIDRCRDVLGRHSRHDPA